MPQYIKKNDCKQQFGEEMKYKLINKDKGRLKVVIKAMQVEQKDITILLDKYNSDKDALMEMLELI